MSDIMIDIETLGVGREVPMFQIGACAFDSTIVEEEFVLPTFSVNLDLFDVIWNTGFMPDEDTVGWWRGQKYPNRENMEGLVDALDYLDQYVMEIGPVHIWANSPQFDLAIIQDHYRALGRKTPWSFRQEMDFRTIRGMWKRGKYPSLSFESHVPHDALSDAESQAFVLQRMLRDMDIVW